MNTALWIYKIAPALPVPATTFENQSDHSDPILPASELDKSSQFIHMSKADQILGTLNRFFPTTENARDTIWLLKLPVPENLERNNTLRWETPDATVGGLRDGEGLFPHLYFFQDRAEDRSSTDKSVTTNSDMDFRPTGPRLWLRKDEVISTLEVISDIGDLGWDKALQNAIKTKWLE